MYVQVKWVINQSINRSLDYDKKTKLEMKISQIYHTHTHTHTKME